jgi:hypothetical protein
MQAANSQTPEDDFLLYNTFKVGARIDRIKNEEQNNLFEINSMYNMYFQWKSKYYTDFTAEYLLYEYYVPSSEYEDEYEREMISDYSAVLDCGLEIRDYIKTFVLASYESRESYDLELRFNSGVGLKFVFSNNDFLFLQLSVMPLWNIEKYKDSEINRSMRLSFGYNDTWHFVPDVFSISASFYYKPFYDNWKAYILEYKQNLIFEITDTVSLWLVYTWNIERKPNVIGDTEKYDSSGGVYVDKYASKLDIDYEKMTLRLEFVLTI